MQPPPAVATSLQDIHQLPIGKDPNSVAHLRRRRRPQGHVVIRRQYVGDVEMAVLLSNRRGDRRDPDEEKDERREAAESVNRNPVNFAHNATRPRYIIAVFLCQYPLR